MNNTHARVNSERKWQPRLRCQTESRYVQTVPDRKCLCPDTPRRKMPMSRLSCVQESSCPDFRGFKRPFVETFVRSKLPMSGILCVPNQKSSAAILIFCAFLSRLSCFQKTLCRDFIVFKIAYIWIFECYKPKTVRCKIGILCVFAEIMLSKDLMSRLQCVQNCLCPNF